jgi:membrane fusion protein (multidrug efflux system)
MAALVEQLRATIRKKQISAPFSGRLGIREVNLGQFVNNGDKIVSLQALDPIFIDFLLPQQLIAGVAPGQKVKVTTDVYPGRAFEGELTAVNTEIDPVTRNIRLQATLQNPKGELRPGMFGRVVLAFGGADEVVRIPATALLRAPYGDSVFVLEEESNEEGVKKTVAKQRFVRIGRSQGDFVAVTEGVKAGETIVSAGAFKLRNGSAVTVNNEMAADPQMRPTPPNS